MLPPSTPSAKPTPTTSATASGTPRAVSVKRESSVPLTSAFALATPSPNLAGKGKKTARPIGSLTPFGLLGGVGGSSASGRAGQASPSPAASRSNGSGHGSGNGTGSGQGHGKRLPPAPLFHDPGPSTSNSSASIKGEIDERLRSDTPLRAVSETSSSLSIPPPGQRPIASLTSTAQTPDFAPPTPSRLVALKKEDTTLSLRKTPKKLSALSSFSTSPFSPRASIFSTEHDANNDTLNAKRRRLGEVGQAMPLMPDPKGKGKVKAVEGKTVGLGAVNDAVRLDEIDMDEWEAKRGKEEVEVEVGIGISPRKGNVKWNGRGEPPMSMRLASLTSTESASLTLFYTSLYHTLNPSIRTPSKSSRLATDPTRPVEPPSKGVSALTHIRTAPIRLVLIRPASARMHHAHLWVAAVLRWPRPARPAHSHLRSAQSSDREGDEDEPSPSQIIVNLSLASNSSRPTGVDPRKVEERWRAEGPASASGQGGVSDSQGWVDETRELVSTWEVGVWSEWGMMDLPRPPSDERGPGGGKRVGKVLFATRYLVAEGKLREG